VSAGTLFNLALQVPATSVSSTMTVSLAARNGATYRCNPIKLRATTTSLDSSMRLTSVARFFRSISFQLATDGVQVVDEASISNYQASFNPSFDRAVASSVCTTLQTQLAWASERGKWGLQRFRGSSSKRTRR
jgi:hypothetical protein